jgi:hypothetical protein
VKKKEDGKTIFFKKSSLEPIIFLCYSQNYFATEILPHEVLVNFPAALAVGIL